jgi:hypothetical protein
MYQNITIVVFSSNYGRILKLLQGNFDLKHIVSCRGVLMYVSILLNFGLTYGAYGVKIVLKLS